MVDYLRDIIRMYSTVDPVINEQNKDFLEYQIQAKLKDQNILVEKEQVGEVLDSLKNILESESRSQDEKNLLLVKMIAAYYKVGLDAFTLEQGQVTHLAGSALSQQENLSIREAGWLHKSTWIVIMLCYLSDSGLNYRNYLEGKISGAQFWTQTSLLSLSTIEGLLGGVGGTAVGFALGNTLLPGIGGILGSVVGGLAGSFAGDNVMLSSYQSLENRIHYAKELTIEESGRATVTYERYVNALAMIGALQNDSLEEIEKKFLN